MYIVAYFSILFFVFFCMYCYRGYFPLTEKSLDKQKLFWAALIIPLLSCLYFGIPVWSNYSFDMSANGYSEFLKISTLPLYILASAPIFAAFVANTHRTIQTAKQITETEKKNKVDLVFSKYNFANERLSKVTFLCGRKLASTDTIILLFFHIKDTGLYINKKAVNELNSKIFNMIKIRNKIEVDIDRVNDSCEESEIPDILNEIGECLREIDSTYIFICMRLGIYFDDNSDSQSSHPSMLKSPISKNISLEYILGDGGRIKAQIQAHVDMFIHDLKKIIDILSIIDERVKNCYEKEITSKVNG
ncbi:hypothetical protein M2263_003930 [Providencia alcalifaciens]|nr:hypothetical protein [Providencia alcalifaciens]